MDNKKISELIKKHESDLMAAIGGMVAITAITAITSFALKSQTNNDDCSERIKQRVKEQEIARIQNANKKRQMECMNLNQYYMDDIYDSYKEYLSTMEWD